MTGPWKEHATPKSECPTCSYRVDSATSAGHRRPPKPGDVSVCLNCAAANIFTADLTLRSATMDEQESFGLDVARVQLAVKQSSWYRTLVRRSAP